MKTSPLHKKLLALRPKLAAAAQRVVDDWQQDDDGVDEELGEGGACDRVSVAIADVIHSSIRGVDTTCGGQDGDDHAYIVVFDEREAFAVDIPPSVYETGGGYRWRKRKDAHIEPDDVIIERVNHADIMAGLARGRTKRWRA